jgi:ribosomal protein uS3
VANRGLCAEAQAESLRFKLLGGLAVRRACYGILKFVMESGAKGVEVVVSGKLRGARAKAMTFRDGYMIKSGQSNKDFVRKSVRHVFMRQGILGVRVYIMLPRDSDGEKSTKNPMADVVEVTQPKEADPRALGVRALQVRGEAVPAM